MSGGTFAARLLAWHRRHGRRDLPWLRERDPYRVWLSEIMLQQTQVTTVLPYFARFVERFPDVQALASAPAQDVMAHWAGLGYYARARNLHACAQAVVAEHGGRFPSTARALSTLPGIGRSTAAAIAAFCHGERAAILDGNVKRVLARHWAIEGPPDATPVLKQLWHRAEQELPQTRQMRRYTQAIMDLGATVCTRSRPTCGACPVQATCRALQSDRVEALPSPKPRLVRPVRRARVLVAVADGRVLLQRRQGSNGIWAGLMCLPEFESVDALKRKARLLGAVEPPARLGPRRHLLTHLELRIEPYLAVALHAPPVCQENSEQWIALAQAPEAGVPAPYRVLLEELRASAGTADRLR